MRHRIELDDYEVANLREALVFLYDVGGDTGDWYRQVLNKLPSVEIAPNRTRQEHRRELAFRVGWNAMQWPKS